MTATAMNRNGWAKRTLASIRKHGNVDRECRGYVGHDRESIRLYAAVRAAIGPQPQTPGQDAMESLLAMADRHDAALRAAMQEWERDGYAPEKEPQATSTFHAQDAHGRVCYLAEELGIAGGERFARGMDEAG